MIEVLKEPIEMNKIDYRSLVFVVNWVKGKSKFGNYITP